MTSPGQAPLVQSTSICLAHAELTWRVYFPTAQKHRKRILGVIDERRICIAVKTRQSYLSNNTFVNGSAVKLIHVPATHACNQNIKNDSCIFIFCLAARIGLQETE